MVSFDYLVKALARLRRSDTTNYLVTTTTSMVAIIMIQMFDI